MIDLRSDTVTRPSEEMRDAARAAEVSDEKRDGDPTVRELEDLVAERLDMEAGVFLPSGTMANQIAPQVHTNLGEEVIIDRWAHVFTSEFAGYARFSGLQVRTINATPDGCPTAEEVEAAFQERSQWPGFGLLVLENTHNKRGGLAIPPKDIDEAALKAQKLGMNVHLDGARLANAAVALNQPLREFTDHADSVMFDLCKGLGAPVGAVLAGDSEFVTEARNYRNAFGGGMRQAGIIAAPGITALDNVERLSQDHENAAVLGKWLDDETELNVQAPETNLLLVDTDPTGLTGEQFLNLCHENGVLAGSISDSVVRFCTHLDITRSDIEEAADRIVDALDRAEQ